ncbi:MAG TPA: class I SAM-dependent methyltransferase [Phycisphaeraceae bacterium]
MDAAPSARMTEPTYYYRGIPEIDGGDGVWDVDCRWPEVEAHADLRPDDHVLDVGCAEGLITIEIAQRVKHVHGVELRSQRVEAARKIAAERGVSNVTFEQGSIDQLLLAPQSYDVVLFLGVLQHLPAQAQFPSLAKVLGAARRQVLMRMPIFDNRFPTRLTGVAFTCQQFGYRLTVLPQRERWMGNMLIADRVEQR